MDENKARLISEHVLGTFVLSEEDLADPPEAAASIWFALQNVNPDWFEEGGVIMAEGVTLTQDDLLVYIAEKANAED